MSQASIPYRRRFHLLFPLGVVVLYAWLLALTITDYGVMFDVWELYTGDKYLNYFATLNPAHLDFEADSIRLYDSGQHPDFHDITTSFPDIDATQHPLLIWPLGAMLASLSKYIFNVWLPLFGPFDASHLMLIPFAAALLGCVWSFTLQRFGRWPAVVAILVTALHPRLWAHMHNNIKDVPTAVFWTLTIASFAVGAERRAARWLLLSAVCWGLGLATKANGVFLPAVLVPYFLLILWQRKRDRQPLTHTREVLACLLYPVIGLALMIGLWPLLWEQFPSQVFALVDSLRSRAGGAATGWNPWPLRLAFGTMSPVAGLALIAGLGVSIRGLARDRRRRADYLLVLLWTVVPVLRVSMPGTHDFDGIRHWLEFIPGAAILCGIGTGPLLARLAAWLQRRVEARHGVPKPPARLAPPAPGAAGADPTAVVEIELKPAPAADEPAAPVILPVLGPLLLVLALLAPTGWWLYRNHPHSVVYFNRVVGGLAAARAKGYPEATDYWANSYRVGSDWLYEHAEPGSTIYIGVAEHIGVYTRNTWLPDHLRLSNLTGRAPDDVDREISASPAPVYLMYVTREGWYHARVRDAIARDLPVAYQIDVDGAPILVIRRLK